GGYSDGIAFVMEAVLTLGLVSVILGTASGAQNIGLFGAFGVGAYVSLAGLWGGPISGASMNPARTFGPDLIAADFTSYWVYVLGPLVGAVLAVGAAWVLRGAGGGRSGSAAAQGDLHTEVQRPDKAYPEAPAPVVDVSTPRSRGVVLPDRRQPCAPRIRGRSQRPALRRATIDELDRVGVSQ